MGSHLPGGNETRDLYPRRGGIEQCALERRKPHSLSTVSTGFDTEREAVIP